jgi:hypothetical protein
MKKNKNDKQLKQLQTFNHKIIKVVNNLSNRQKKNFNRWQFCNNLQHSKHT